MNRLFTILVVCLVLQGIVADVKSKRQECRDLAGDRSNCQRFIRCFHNLRVLFTCPAGTAYEPESRTCVAKNLVKTCGDSKNRIEVTISTNATQGDEEYPTIAADINALEAPAQKGISTKGSAANTPKQFGCASYCQNQGVCVLAAQSVSCQCPTGYTGLQCQVAPVVVLAAAPNQCQPTPCQNGGTCYLRQGTFGCSCPVGFSGVCCEINLAATNPCYANPCINSGTCQVAGLNLYRCVCPTGFNGLRCELRVCEPNPCLYGGVCLILGNSFQCQCPPQYTGPTCEILIPPPNPCASEPCLNGGTCTPTSPTTFVCSCTPNYYGPICETRNYCIPNPCYNGGSCVATTTGYICQCPYPFTSSNCEVAITPAPRPVCACVVCPCPTPVVTVVNPCLPNPCQNNGGCAVYQNVARCYCPTTYTGYYCQFARKRAMSTAPCSNVTCSNGGECIVNEDGPQCTCPKPYYGDRCELINRPRTCNPSPCGKNGQCVSTKDGYKCVCKNGLTGVLCEQKMMPANYRWCPLECAAGTSCVFEGTKPKCRVL